MRFNLFSFVLATLSVQQAVSFPLGKRASSLSSIETRTLQVAQILEHLEAAFYDQAFEKFNQAQFSQANLSPAAVSRYQEIAAHEVAHVEILNEVLGDDAVQPCTYDFNINSVEEFTTLSRTLESLGADAYTGAISYIESKEILAISAGILATETRHAEWIETAITRSAIFEGSFEPSVSLSIAVTLASLFIESCPNNKSQNAGLESFEILNITASPDSKVAPGGNATVALPASSNATINVVSFLTGSGQIDVNITNGSITFPDNVVGQVYAVGTQNGGAVTDNNTIAVAILAFDQFLNGSITS